jgi:hypothetical protein
MNVLLFGVRVALGLLVVGVASTYAAMRIHERANVVDVETLPLRTAPAGTKPAPVRPRDVPGREVREQVDFLPGGGPGCAPPDRGGVAISVGFQNEAVIGGRVETCPEGFIAGKEASLRISGHGLSAASVHWLPPRPWSWNVPPHALPGSYRARAVQGRREAGARVRLITSPIPFVRIRAFAEKPAVFDVVVGGAPPGRHVPVHLYRAVKPTDPERDYFSTLEVETDEQGNGSIAVRGTGGSTYTCYVVVPGFWRDPQQQGPPGWYEPQTESQFCFGEPDLE